MTEIDRGEPQITEDAVTSLNRSAAFWGLRNPLYAKQLLELASNHALLLERVKKQSDKQFALVIGEQIAPFNFADLDEAFDFAESNTNGQAAIIHEIKLGGIPSNQVYERFAPWKRVKGKTKREKVYSTMGLEQGIVEWSEEMNRLSPEEKVKKIQNDFPGSSEVFEKQRNTLKN